MKAEGNKPAVLISGGNSGLGFSTAKHFLSLGHTTVICGRNGVRVSEAVSLLQREKDLDSKVLGFECDVTNYDQTRNMFLKILKENIQIKVLICNAGSIGPIDKFLNVDLDEWRESTEINLFGTVNLVKVFLPSMLESQGGRVIHLSGGGATSPLFGMSSYAASKAAAVRFIETLALEYSETDVTFNSVAPGILKTKLLSQMLDAGPDRIGKELFTKSSNKASAENDSTNLAIELIYFLAGSNSDGISGKLISAEWDKWSTWPLHIELLKNTDLFTIRRITSEDRGVSFGDVD
jgi:NAD(P)-dependent dehydrogenase (short-subunit alcohol dehydrogenase family)